MKKGVAGKRCPKCNNPCKKSDIRPLFATAVKVKETSGEEKLQQQLQQALKVQHNYFAHLSYSSYFSMLLINYTHHTNMFVVGRYSI
jgi:hypothetical protein